MRASPWSLRSHVAVSGPRPNTLRIREQILAKRQQQERTGKFLLRCCPMEVIQYGAFLHAAGIEACVSLLHCGAAGGMLILSGPVDVIKKSGQNDFVAVEVEGSHCTVAGAMPAIEICIRQACSRLV